MMKVDIPGNMLPTDKAAHFFKGDTVVTLTFELALGGTYELSVRVQQ